METRETGEEVKAAMHMGENIRKISLVIIRQYYAYLERFVRSMFGTPKISGSLWMGDSTNAVRLRPQGAESSKHFK